MALYLSLSPFLFLGGIITSGLRSSEVERMDLYIGFTGAAPFSPQPNPVCLKWDPDRSRAFVCVREHIYIYSQQSEREKQEIGIKCFRSSATYRKSIAKKERSAFDFFIYILSLFEQPYWSISLSPPCGFFFSFSFVCCLFYSIFSPSISWNRWSIGFDGSILPAFSGSNSLSFYPVNSIIERERETVALFPTAHTYTIQ